MTNETHNHKWECSDIPGLYNCLCGAGAYWNRVDQQIVQDV